MPTSNIDDLLMGTVTPEAKQPPQQQEEVQDSSVYENETSTPPEVQPEPESEPDYHEESSDDTEEKQDDASEDEYGNKSTPDNDVIRDRLARQAESLKRKHQQELDTLRQQLAASNANPAVQKAADNFQYDENSEANWEQQLKQFVKQTLREESAEQQQATVRQREAQVQAEFESKFHDGMSKFNDFVDVVGAQPITDAMTIATRSMKDPAAFLYAASKRHSPELQRISQMTDPYAQIAEIGRLEERMKKSSTGTSASKVLGKTSGDMGISHKTSKKESSIEERMMEADRKKAANFNIKLRR